MPARPIQHEHDLLVGASTRLTRELRQLHFKHRNADRGGQMEKSAPRRRVHKANEITPGEAMAHHGDGALADRGPHPTQQWLEADAMFIGRPPLDLRLREGGGDRP